MAIPKPQPVVYGNRYRPISRCIEKLTKIGIAKILPNLFFGSLLVIFVFLTSFSLLDQSYAVQYDREIYTKSIFTKWIDGNFHHAFAVCGSELISGDMILVSSDIAIKPLKIQDDELIGTCKSFDVSIIVSNPSSIKLEVIKIEDKKDKIIMMEKKISSLENIVQRLFADRDDLIYESSTVEENSSILEKAEAKLERISELINYKKITSKKLAIISST